ncbi:MULTISPECIES: hypothetical protein [unclassified Meiothermus]|uniref:hypothetical protein n=1 Tax=unclassified Meiothermus TaxID=370471 RepID=UPI000D7CD30E|nr:MULTISPECIES: hypothetical protein [unclassified Meiothermus]PZA08038.1 hypothetical protein DNA98_07025 [Meiothermus sp. Pnk-1]RYM32714.1 hypothetical protein EWH23_13920 [Meiothermus sp. PNK-Is4]
MYIRSSGPGHLILRPSRTQLVARIAFLCLFALGALALIRVSPQLGPVAYGFVGLPLLFALDALLTFATRLEVDESGISQTHYRSSWSYRWGEIAGWNLHEMSPKGPNLVAIELYLAAGGRQKLTPALVQYKDANYFKLREALLHYLGPPSR